MIAQFCGCSTVSRLRSDYIKSVYFCPLTLQASTPTCLTILWDWRLLKGLSFQEFLALSWTIYLFSNLIVYMMCICFLWAPFLCGKVLKDRSHEIILQQSWSGIMCLRPYYCQLIKHKSCHHIALYINCKFFKGFSPQILLSPFLKTFSCRYYQYGKEIQFQTYSCYIIALV